MTGAISSLDTSCGRDVAVAIDATPADPRHVSMLVFSSSWEVLRDAPAARERAALWASWSTARQERALKRLSAALDAAWPEGCTARAVASARHRHLGELSGELSLDRCVPKELDPTYTKPMRAFWTCPVVSGTGPVGFELLIRELEPGRSYASWDVMMEPCDIRVVDSADDWAALVATTGPDPGRSTPCPRWEAVAVDAVHVTNRAIIGSFAAPTPLWDWGMEQTAWLKPRGAYTRQSATETWEQAVRRLSARR